MANNTNSVISFRKRPDSDAVRAKRYREKRKAKENAEALAPALQTLTSPVRDATPSRAENHTTPSRDGHVSWPLIVAAFALAAVGVTMNGWYARSLGSSDATGWLFLALGIAADVIALGVPAKAAALWKAHQRVTSAIGWAVWVAAFIFAMLSGIGFASTNVSDVTMSRASRVTPAVTVAQAALNDATAARDRECKSGVGRVCRDRETVVNDRQHALDAAMHDVADAADPQTVAAMKIVSWLSKGAFTPTAEDFALLRLIFIAMLPQVGGIVLLVGRGK